MEYRECRAKRCPACATGIIGQGLQITFSDDGLYLPRKWRALAPLTSARQAQNVCRGVPGNREDACARGVRTDASMRRNSCEASLRGSACRGAAFEISFLGQMHAGGAFGGGLAGMSVGSFFLPSFYLRRRLRCAPPFGGEKKKLGISRSYRGECGFERGKYKCTPFHYRPAGWTR